MKNLIKKIAQKKNFDHKLGAVKRSQQSFYDKGVFIELLEQKQC